MQTIHDATESYLVRLDAAVLRRVVKSDCTQQEIADELGLSQPTVSRSLHRLRQAGKVVIVTDRKGVRKHFKVAQ